MNKINQIKQELEEKEITRQEMILNIKEQLN